MKRLAARARLAGALLVTAIGAGAGTVSLASCAASRAGTGSSRGTTMATRNVTIFGRQVTITEGATPQDARLVIDSTNIPLIYHAQFGGWSVEHTTYGFYSDLEQLAEHIISSNPSLTIGHGNGGHDH